MKVRLYVNEEDEALGNSQLRRIGPAFALGAGDDSLDAIILELTAQDKKNISEMDPEASLFAVFHDSVDARDINDRLEVIKAQEDFTGLGVNDDS